MAQNRDDAVVAQSEQIDLVFDGHLIHFDSYTYVVVF